MNGKLLVFLLHPTPPPHPPPQPHLGLLSPEPKPRYSYTLIFTVAAPPTHEHVSPFHSSVFYLPNTVSVACRVCQIPSSLKTLLHRSLSSFHDHKDDLRKRLSYTTHKLEMVETEFDSTRQYLETELRRAQEELEKFTEKLRRCVCLSLNPAGMHSVVNLVHQMYNSFGFISCLHLVKSP